MMLAVAGDRWDNAGEIAIQSAGFAVAVCICVIAALACAVATYDVSAAGAALEIEATVNPNVAPPASLARLPGIGPVRAQAIVSHRSRLARQGRDGPAFRCPEDLRAIPGIGPATVGAISPWLSFDN